jgi:hypothetical protein
MRRRLYSGRCQTMRSGLSRAGRTRKIVPPRDSLFSSTVCLQREPINLERSADVRFSTSNGRGSYIAACPKSANISGLMHRSKGLFDDLVGQREQH